MQLKILFLASLLLWVQESSGEGGHEEETPTFPYLMERAQAYLSEADYVNAADVLLQAVEISPDDENVNALLGTSFLALERADVAEGFLYASVAASNYTNVGAVNNLAEALRINGDLELAEQVLKLAIYNTKGSDRSGLLEYSLGVMYEDKEDFVAAAEWYLAAAILEPTNFRYWTSASTLGFKKEYVDLNAAERVLVQGLVEIPMHPDLLFQMGLVMQQTNRLVEACTFYEQVLRVDPEYFRALPNLATAYHSLRQFEKALHYYEKALEQNSRNSILLQNFAVLLDNMGFHQYSLRVINSAADMEPDNVYIRALQDTLQRHSRDANVKTLQAQANIIEEALSANWDEVVNILLQAGTPAEDSSWWFFTAGIAQFFRGNYTDAYQCCDKARRLSHRPSHLFYGCMGIAMQYGQDYDGAIKHFQIAYNLQSNASYEDPLPYLGFAMDREDIEMNLIQALNVRGDYKECVTRSLEMLELPAPSEGGVAVLLFSMVDWSPSMRKYVNSFGFEQLRDYNMTFFKRHKLFDEASRVRNSKKKLLNAAYECATSSRDEVVERASKLSSEAISRGAQQSPSPVRDTNTTDQKFVLITQFYLPSDPSLQRSLQEVLRRNLLHEAIEEVYLMCDADYSFDQLPNHHKITKLPQSRRLQFADAFRVMNERLRGRVVILANSDICFDESLRDLSRSLPGDPRLVLALSKWTPVGGASSLSLSLRSDSQDAWVLSSPVPEQVLQQSGFFLGAPRCDNRLAQVFLDAGYRVKNPSFFVHAIELDDQVRRQRLYSKVGEVHGEGANVPVSDSHWLRRAEP